METNNGQDHHERGHALLSPSGAHRWLNCTPSARLEEKMPPKPTSVYAEEGTLAHELAELFLCHDTLCTLSDDEFSDKYETIMANKLFSEEMLDMVPIYTDYCAEEYKAAKSENSGAEMYVESKINISEYVPEGFGSADCTIVNDSVMEVIDLKYGKGIPVSAEWNVQEMLYALGMLLKFDMLYDIEQIKLTIVQPRLNNISSWIISVEDLLKWANDELKPKAKMAFNGEGQLEAGDWCRFCAVKNRCRTLYDKQLELTKYEFAKPELLSDEQIADVLNRIPQLVAWADSVKEYASDLAINQGKHWPGFKLVEGISRRQWIADEDKICNTIYEKFPTATEDDLFSMKLKPITSIEKLFGKKAVAEMLSDVIIKPAGKPTLVPEDDKRPALGTEDAINDFK